MPIGVGAESVMRTFEVRTSPIQFLCASGIIHTLNEMSRAHAQN